MGQPNEKKRFRVNPIELAVFATVSIVFVNSLYQLFYDWDEIRASIIRPTAQQLATKATKEDRTLASANPAVDTIEVKCGLKQLTEPTRAAKVKLFGSLCGNDAVLIADKQKKSSTKTALIKTEVTNKTTNSAATVMANPIEGSFSTEYIPLNAGKNDIQIRFVYQGGKEFNQHLFIQKN